MKETIRLLVLMLALALVAAACGDSSDDTTTVAPATTTAAPTTTAGDGATTTQATTTEAPMAGLECGDGVTVGVITDQTGALAVYGAHMLRGIPAGFGYATNSAAGNRRRTSRTRRHRLLHALGSQSQRRRTDFSSMLVQVFLRFSLKRWRKVQRWNLNSGDKLSPAQR